MSIKAWCEANGINVRRYHYWLRKVREYAAQFMPANYAKPEISQGPADAPNGWALVKAEPESASSGMYSEEGAMTKTRSNESVPVERGSVAVEIGGFRVTATADASEDTLKKVFRTLVSIC